MSLSVDAAFIPLGGMNVESDGSSPCRCRFSSQMSLQSLFSSLSTSNREELGAPHPWQKLVLLICLILAMLMSIKWCFIVNINLHFSND